jgi:hypothetical protein
LPFFVVIYARQPNPTIKDKETGNHNNQLLERIEMLEARTSQLEAELNNSITFETLAARLIGNPENKKGRKPRTKREWTPE